MICERRSEAGELASNLCATPEDGRRPSSISLNFVNQESPIINRYSKSETLLLVVFGGVLLWLAFPPVGWFPLAWVAAWPWLAMISRPVLAGRRPYWQVYVGGFATWMLMLQWVRLPHWAAWFGWVAMAVVMGGYFLLFVVSARALVHRRGWPVWIAAPVVWVGVELVRGYLFTGFSMLLVGHTVYRWPMLIQLADLGGAYLVSFVMLVTSGLAYEGIRAPRAKIRWGPIAAALLLLAAQIGYGAWRLSQTQVDAGERAAVEVMLVQGSIDTTFDEDQDPYDARATYANLTRQALRSGDRPDLIVWPESMYSVMVEVAKPGDERHGRLPADVENVSAAELERWHQHERQLLARFAGEWQTQLVLGCSTLDYSAERVRRFNSALFVNLAGEVEARYDKMHPVLFGEYVPLGNWFPWLYRLTPMQLGLDAGEDAVPFRVNDVVFSPAVCFENTVPHLVRRQVRQLRREGTPASALLTITNDGWFWGSSLLDLHLACGVFRAVEHHLPMVIGANTGFSASIDPAGRIVAQGPRRAEGIVQTRVYANGSPQTGYQRLGDIPAAGCAVGVVYGLILAFRRRAA